METLFVFWSKNMLTLCLAQNVKSLKIAKLGKLKYDSNKKKCVSHCSKLHVLQSRKYYNPVILKKTFAISSKKHGLFET